MKRDRSTGEGGGEGGGRERERERERVREMGGRERKVQGRVCL